jgi:hypothetical protein
MPEGNGSGRLDRIEANLERLTERFDAMVEHHDREFKQLLTWQVLMQDKMERMAATQETEQKRLDALSEKTDRRIGELVSAIGKLIERAG